MLTVSQFNPAPCLTQLSHLVFALSCGLPVHMSNLLHVTTQHCLALTRLFKFLKAWLALSPVLSQMSQMSQMSQVSQMSRHETLETFETE
jgi:hypothetical protein